MTEQTCITEAVDTAPPAQLDSSKVLSKQNSENELCHSCFGSNLKTKLKDGKSICEACLTGCNCSDSFTIFDLESGETICIYCGKELENE